jgi:hypothetical protein
MTRKDYTQIAKALFEARPRLDDHAAHSQWRSDCLAITARLDPNNPHFDGRRFLLECGWGID